MANDVPGLNVELGRRRLAADFCWLLVTLIVPAFIYHYSKVLRAQVVGVDDWQLPCISRCVWQYWWVSCLLPAAAGAGVLLRHCGRREVAALGFMAIELTKIMAVVFVCATLYGWERAKVPWVSGMRWHYPLIWEPRPSTPAPVTPGGRGKARE